MTPSQKSLLKPHKKRLFKPLNSQKRLKTIKKCLVMGISGKMHYLKNKKKYEVYDNK
jgi:hypothetical protein